MPSHAFALYEKLGANCCIADVHMLARGSCSLVLNEEQDI